LNFPLSKKFGKEALRGVGGTRNCDWWFTDEAVLLDTAGRYTTQDSDAESDQAGWTEFLSLLRKHRSWQPTNSQVPALQLCIEGHSASPLQGVTQIPKRHSSSSSSSSKTVSQSVSTRHCTHSPASHRVRSPSKQSVSSSQLLSSTQRSFSQTLVQTLSQSSSEQMGLRMS
jgi:hypothetical protein